MANYLLAYHGGGMPDSPEEGARIMALWTKWFGELGPAIVDGGNPVGRTATIASDGTVSDGGGANPVSGYSVIKADSFDEAVRMARGCPLLESGGVIEVGETFSAM